MKKNGALDIICKILSVFLSIALVVSLLVTVLFASVNNLLQPKTIIKIISEVAGSNLIENETPKISAENNTLSFTPVVLMGGFFYNNETGESFIVMPEDKPQADRSEVTYDESVEYDGSDSTSSSNTYYVDENGNIILNGEVIGSTGHKTGSNSHFAGTDESFSNQGIAGNMPSREENFATGDSFSSSQVGGADAPENAVTDSSNSGSLNLEIEGIAGFEDITEEDAKEVITAFLESDIGKEIIDEYTEAVTDVLEGGEGEIDKEEIKEIIVENKDEIFDFIEEYTGEKLDRDEISAEIDKMLNENFDEFFEQLPQPKELVKELPSEAFIILSIINSKIILNALITLDIVLIALIFVMRLWDFAGFLWLSVDGIVSGVILGVIFLALKVLKGLLLNGADQATALINTLMEAVLSKILLGLIIIFVIAIIFMVVYIIIKNLRKKSIKQN